MATRRLQVKILVVRRRNRRLRCIRPCGSAAPDLTTPSTMRSFRREKRKGRVAVAGPTRSPAEPLGPAGGGGNRAGPVGGAGAGQLRALLAALPERRRSGGGQWNAMANAALPAFVG